MIGNVNATITAVDVIASGSGSSFAVLSLIFCNTNAAADRLVSIYAVPSGGSAATANLIVKDKLIRRNDTFVWTANEKFILYNGQKIMVSSDANNDVVVTYNGMAI